jgi:hypothetical protein
VTLTSVRTLAGTFCTPEALLVAMMPGQVLHICMRENDVVYKLEPYRRGMWQDGEALVGKAYHAPSLNEAYVLPMRFRRHKSPS